MGAISKIRQLSPYFLAVIAVLFIAFMVIQDSSCSTIRQSQQSPENIAIADVNGETISLAEFEQRVAMALENARAQNQGQEIDDEQLRQQVFDAMVEEVLRRQAAEEMGLSVTKKELLDNMLLNPPKEWADQFRDSNGVFQRKIYEDYVTNPNKIVEVFTAQGVPMEQAEKTKETFVKQLFMLEDYIRTAKLQEAIGAAVGSAASVPSLNQAKLDYKVNNSTADIRFVAIPADLVSDAQAKPTDDELKQHYEKNKEYYEQKPSRKIKYVTFKQEPSDKDTLRAQRRSAKFGETLTALPAPADRDTAFNSEMIASGGRSSDWVDTNQIDPALMMVLSSMQVRDVFGPLSLGDGIHYVRLDDRRNYEEQNVRASHILLAFGSDKEASRKQAEDILNRAKGGEDFAALAQQYSTDPGSAAKGGDLDFFGPGRMVKPFEEAAFAAAKGEIVGPVETQFGWHIIKVTDKKSLGTRLQFKYSDIVYRPIMSTATKQMIIAKAAKLAESVEDGTPIETAAKEVGLTVNESTFFVRSLAILSSQELTNWAFDSEKGDVIRKDIKNYGLVVAQVTETREAGIMTFEDAKDRMIREVTQRKKMDVMKGMADRVNSAIKTAGTIDVASTVDSTLIVRSNPGTRANGQVTGFGGEFELTQAAFTQPIGAIGDPIRGKRAWFIMVVDARTEADMKNFEANKIASLQNSSASQRSSAFYSWFRSYKENATIEDLRGKRD